MTSENIYAILSSKPHNPHYLNRYIRLIAAVQSRQNQNGLYLEAHHICPKSKDLFPEYADFKKLFPWNKILMTDREHFLAHHLLAKAYPKSRQTYAFKCMLDNQTPTQLKRSIKIINSKTYQIVKALSKNVMQKTNKNKASYKDVDGNPVYCRTDDPRVLQGTLISTTLGRKMPERQTESRNLSSVRLTDSYWKRIPIRKVTLYFLDNRIEVQYTRDDYKFLEYLEQGWSMRVTKEYTTKISQDSNFNRQEESRKKSGESIRKRIQQKREAGIKIRRDYTKEDRKKLRRYPAEDFLEYCFNTETEEFQYVDILDIEYPSVRVFAYTKNTICVFSENDVRRQMDSRVTKVPPGYYLDKSNFFLFYFNIQTKIAERKRPRDCSQDDVQVVVMKTPGRILIYTKEGTSIYWHKDLIEKYGVPSNFTTEKPNKNKSKI